MKNLAKSYFWWLLMDLEFKKNINLELQNMSYEQSIHPNLDLIWIRNIKQIISLNFKKVGKPPILYHPKPKRN